MEFNYSDEHQLIQKTARDFAEKSIAPSVAARDKEGRFAEEIFSALADLGFLGMMIPERWNGAGLDTMSYVLALEEIAAVDPAIAVTLSVQNSLVNYILSKYGTDVQKERWLKPLATGDIIGAFSLSEPQSGSDASNMRCIVRREGDELVINGTKNWVTNGGSSGVVLLFAMADKEKRHHGIDCVIVPKGTPGFSVGKKENKMGIRSSDTTELVFDNCRIPAENLLGSHGEGFKMSMEALDAGRIGIAAQAVGIARAALEKSTRYAQERRQFGRSLSNFGAIQEKIALMGTKTESARLLIHKAAWLKDTHQPFSHISAMAKYAASQAAMENAIDAVQIHGGYGYMTDYGIERLMRDAKITQIYEGTSEIQLLVIARELFKLYS